MSYWDNDSSIGRKEIGYSSDLGDCLKHCEGDVGCLQCAIRQGRCYTFHLPRLGKSAPGVESGWLVERVEKMRATMPDC